MPLDASFKLPKGVRLWEPTALKSLPIPWPRSQDVQEASKEPKEGDLLIIISMPWKYQMHPDPHGDSVPVIHELIKRAANKLRVSRRRVFVFEYYLSLPQFPLTEEEKVDLVGLVEFLPQLFLKSDAILHIQDSVARAPVPGDGASYSIEAEELMRCMLWEIDGMVQVGSAGSRLEQREGQRVRIFDQVVAYGERRVKSIHDIPVRSMGTCCACGVSNTGTRCVDQLTGMTGLKELQELMMGKSSASSRVELLRQKYGYKHDASVNAGDTGRIFFERFVSMVKIARGGTHGDDPFVYCNQKAIEQEIFEGSEKLKQAMLEGPSVLSAQLECFQKELEGKQFPPEIRLEDAYQVKSLRHSSPDSNDSDATLCQFDSKERITNLMAALLEESQIGPSLILWRSVVEGDLEACLSSLKKKGNPNLSDEFGRTCLYFAVQQRSVDLVKMLIKYKSSPRTRDINGAIALHWVPLLSDATTFELVEVLANADDSMWGVTNNAGVTAFERLYLWAIAEGESLVAFKETLKLMSGNEVQEFESRVRPCSELGPRSVEDQWSRILDKEEVTVSERQINLNGKTRKVHIIKPRVSQKGSAVVLYFGFCRLLPWSLQKSALGIIAHRVQSEILCIGCEAVKPEVLGTDPEQFFKDLHQLVDILPLPDLFILMDSTFGLGLPMLLKLSKRLLGALILNASWCFQASFIGTTMYQKLQKRAAFLSDLSQRRDLDTLVPMLRDFCLAPIAASLRDKQFESAKEMFDVYKAALSTASTDFWRMSVEQPLWNAASLSSSVQERPDTEGRVCNVILASGSHAPSAAIQDAASNLQRSTFPDARCRWLPSCMWFWQMEGSETVSEVALLLKSLTAETSENSSHLSRRLGSLGPLMSVYGSTYSKSTGFL
eukprot:TRINITY_DN7772_c0_g1_i3.p1 TRINITY_DN7772_c0_g1~~TRINITY_DN7772_c0_g1_i3.p1  ORF type:complete len:891 (+),score=139.45 TRINITY_DN7772_c0_g1_i3:87-2759(+)